MKARGWLLRMLLAAVFVAMRLKFNREYNGASWQALVEGTAPLPFGHRVLVPWLVRPWVEAGGSIRSAFAVTEWLSTLAAVAGAEAALRGWLRASEARLAALALLPLLGLVFLLPFRWPIFYPWDVLAIACVLWGVALARSRRHGALVLLAGVGALNRESAILLPFITVALLVDAPHRKEALRSASLQLVAVVLARLGIGALRPISRGGAVDLTVDGMARIDHNLQWLASATNALAIVGAFGALPVVWIAVRRFIPVALRRLEWVVIPCMAGLLVVANVYEPRAWGEPLALLFVGVVVGGVHLLRETPTEDSASWWQRWMTPTVLVCSIVAVALWRMR